jgi:hypothetical protein
MTPIFPNTHVACREPRQSDFEKVEAGKGLRGGVDIVIPQNQVFVSAMSNTDFSFHTDLITV